MNFVLHNHTWVPGLLASATLEPVKQCVIVSARCSGTGAAATVEHLLQLQADCRAADVAGRTPLHAAAAGGHAGISARLLAAEAPPAAVDRGGRTPLHWAALNGHGSTVGVLADAMQAADSDWHAQVRGSCSTSRSTESREAPSRPCCQQLKPCWRTRLSGRLASGRAAELLRTHLRGADSATRARKCL